MKRWEAGFILSWDKHLKEFGNPFSPSLTCQKVTSASSIFKLQWANATQNVSSITPVMAKMGGGTSFFTGFLHCTRRTWCWPCAATLSSCTDHHHLLCPGILTCLDWYPKHPRSISWTSKINRPISIRLSIFGILPFQKEQRFLFAQFFPYHWEKYWCASEEMTPEVIWSLPSLVINDKTWTSMKSPVMTYVQ